jgi:predicted DCC family thiol-disulfide oxidoreductase YuxK
MSRLPWYWKEFQIFWIVPAFIRNAVYDFIAKNRYKWFGKKDRCMIPTPEMRSRFLD